MEKEKE